MKKQSVTILVLVAMLCWMLPALASAEDESSPFDNENLLPTDDSKSADTEDAAPTKAKAEEEKPEKVVLPLVKKAKVVEKQLFTRKGTLDFNLFFGINPGGDSLVFHMTEGLRVGFYPTEYFGLQVVNGFIQNFDREDTKDRLKNQNVSGFSPDFTATSEMNGFTNVDLVFYPIYGKFALAGSAIGHYDIGIYTGGGVMYMANGSTAGIFDPDDEIIGAWDIGVTGTVHVLDWLALRADFAYYLGYLSKDNAKKLLPKGLTTEQQNQQLEQLMGNKDSMLRHSYFITVGVSFNTPSLF